MKQSIKDVRVKINGTDIELNNFVETIFGNTILGMVASLRLDEAPARIEICVETEPSQNDR